MAVLASKCGQLETVFLDALIARNFVPSRSVWSALGYLQGEGPREDLAEASHTTPLTLHSFVYRAQP